MLSGYCGVRVRGPPEDMVKYCELLTVLADMLKQIGFCDIGEL